jgi:uracil-DNA glycosylase
MFFESMHAGWRSVLTDQKPLLEVIEKRISSRVDSGETLAPEASLVMRAFETDPREVRVLIVGQDPYPTAGHAIGLAFAVQNGVQPLPRSLQNMLKELAADIPGLELSGDLSRWQAQGVMLLNRHLTTAVGTAGAHLGLEWNLFTDAAIEALAKNHGHSLVTLLWGNQAQTLAVKLGDAQIIASAHPSPLSAHRGFFGSRPFSRCNELLTASGLHPIDWSC